VNPTIGSSSWIESSSTFLYTFRKNSTAARSGSSVPPRSCFRTFDLFSELMQIVQSKTDKYPNGTRECVSATDSAYLIRTEHERGEEGWYLRNLVNLDEKKT
jgi:hypothetical protein